LFDQTSQLDPALLALIKEHPAGPTLLGEPGVGPVAAAQLLVSWFHRGWVRSEAAFATLAGVAPLEASSGQRTRHRLNRGGDRDLNRALHTIAITRLRCHQQSRDYETKRAAQGKNIETSGAHSNEYWPVSSTARSRQPLNPRQPKSQQNCSHRRLDKHRSVEWPAEAIFSEGHRPVDPFTRAAPGSS